MKAFVRYTLAVTAAYWVAWTVAYIAVMYNAVLRLDFSEYFHWLVLAWTFRGFEMVALTWLLSMGLFLPSAAVAVFLVRRLDRRRKGEPQV